jgi:multiple sugar transport system ATP-binding protein
VFQSYALYPHMTVYDNLAFGLRRASRWAVPGGAESTDPWFAEALGAATRGLPKRWRYESDRERAIATHVRSIAGLLQIEPLLHRLPKQLSGGQKQRVALGRAMARNPQVFLMDEPLSNLDAKLRAETRSQIVKLQRQLGVTTIYVTHDQTEAMTMGDRIAVMNGGILQQLATPLDLYHHPANRFVAEFMGSPPMNFIPVQIQAPLRVSHPSFELTLPERWGQLLRPYDGQMLLLGIRPEHLSVDLSADTSSNLPEHLAVQVEAIEALGHETLVTVMFERQRLQARLGPGLGARSGDHLHLAIDPEHVHLFHPETGQAI